MGARDKERESFDKFIKESGAEFVGRVDHIEHGGAEYKKHLKKIVKALSELSERSGTGVDWILAELYTVFGIDATIKVRYGKRKKK